MTIEQFIKNLEQERDQLALVPEENYNQDYIHTPGNLTCGCKQLHLPKGMGYPEYRKIFKNYGISLCGYIHGSSEAIKCIVKEFKLPMTELTRDGCIERINYVIEYAKTHLITIKDSALNNIEN